MDREIPTYAKVDGPPDDWQQLEVRLDGVLLDDVVEVDTVAGWAIRYARDGEGRRFVRDGEIAKERVEGAFVLSWGPRA